MALHNLLGKQGEDAAVRFLEAKGHTILSRNYRHGKAEVDIVSQIGSCIVFTEVKTRSKSSFGQPEEFVSRKKQKLICFAAEEYLQVLAKPVEARFDILAISRAGNCFEIFHIEDAFKQESE